MALSGFAHNVQWGEFRTVTSRPAGVSEDAHIQARFTYNFSTRKSGGQDCEVRSATLSISVDRSRTWVVQGRTSADLLRHEQGHYNITALGARDLYNQISALTAARCSDISTQAQSIARQIQTDIDQANQRYDNRTGHGTNAAVQRTWDSSIRSAMQSATGTLANLPR